MGSNMRRMKFVVPLVVGLTLAALWPSRVQTQQIVRAYLTYNAAPIAWAADSSGNALVTCVSGCGGAGSTPPYSDSTALVKNASDATKLWKISAASISAGTTRTWTVPDANGTFASTTLTLAQFAATTSAQLAGVLSDETGTGAAVFANTPTLVTPVLGVATATTINRVTLTAPATGSTLTIADGKTLTVSNILTFTGTDSSSVAFGAGGTVQYTTGSPAAFVIASQAAGDILYASSASAWVRLPKGSDGQVLTLASGVPSWAAAGGGSFCSGADGNIGYIASNACANENAFNYNASTNLLTVDKINTVAGGLTVSGTGIVSTTGLSFEFDTGVAYILSLSGGSDKDLVIGGGGSAANVMRIGGSSGSGTAITLGSNLVAPASSGTRYICINTSGVLSSSASACSGT